MTGQSHNTKKQSTYDELHDQYQPLLGTHRPGIKYERLAALVFKSLENSGAVIHDRKLTGDSEVKSQIDVIIEDPTGSQRRILIECKDFDISGDDVDISIVRCFWAVVDDLKPTDAMIVTCNGFTAPAMQYAAHKKIKLAILRKVTPADNLITNIGLDLKCILSTDIHTNWLFPDESTINELKQRLLENGLNLCSSEIYLDGPIGRVKVIDFLHTKIKEYRHQNPKQDSGIIPINLEGCHVIVKENYQFPINAVQITFDDEVFEQQLEFYSKRIAELILNILEDGREDLIIFGDDLERFQIDPETHEVKPVKSE
jgi:hypothetical protein